MNASEFKDHWETVYRTKDPAEVSWFEETPVLSLELVRCYAGPNDAIIDIGGGASRLTGALLKGGFTDLTVLDISGEALDIAKRALRAFPGEVDTDSPSGNATEQRLGVVERFREKRNDSSEEASRVGWIEADVRTWQPKRRYALWHNRAAFHFLTDPAGQRAYAETLKRALSPGGVAIIATFAPDGPEMCSGLPIVRHEVFAERQPLIEMVVRRHAMRDRLRLP